MSIRRALLSLVAVAALGAGVAACSDDTVDKAEEALESAKEDVEDAVNDTAARTQAEAFRAALLAADIEDDSDRRSIEALRDAADELPDDAVVGIEDGDGDGRDDDGLVQIESNDQQACVEVAADGDVEVRDDPCF